MEGKGGDEAQPVTGGRGSRLRQSRGRWWCPRVGTRMGRGMRMQRGMRSRCSPPPPPKSPVLPLPEWLQKALGKDSAVCCKSAGAPWSPQVLEQGCGQDQLFFFDASKGHYTLRWVIRQLFRCLIRKNEEGKGEWLRDAAKGGAGYWQPVPGGPMSPLPESISSGSQGHGARKLAGGVALGPANPTAATTIRLSSYPIFSALAPVSF